MFTFIYDNEMLLKKSYLRRRFSLIELLVVFSIMLILGSLLQPSLNKMIATAQQTECLSLHNKIYMCSYMFTQDNDDFIVPLALRGGTGANAIYYNRWTTWWPDLLNDYLTDFNEIKCASVQKWGIGMNHPELGSWLSLRYKVNEVRRPANTVIFADTAYIQNFNESNSDLWLDRDPEKPTVFFRTPSNGSFYNSSPARVINRHLGRTNVVHVDGHGENVLTSEIGFQYPKNHDLAHWDR